MELTELVNSSPEVISEYITRMAEAFAKKAEETYDLDPEQNGEVAQPYADLANHLDQASLVWDNDEEPMDPDFIFNEPDPAAPTVTAKAAAETKRNPWGSSNTRVHPKNPWAGK